RDAEVRRVRAVTKRVEDERLNAVEERPRLIGNAIAVGEIGKRSDAESEHRQPAVVHTHRDDLDAAERERSGQTERRQLRQTAAELPRRIEDVREHPPQTQKGLLVAKARNRG